MSEANSPTFKQGCEDGARDTGLISTCPWLPPDGPNPPNPAYPVMYMRGYAQEFHPEMAHQECRNCRR